MTDSAQTRPRLRQALIDLCFESGFHSIEIDDLLARAGVDRADFDREFIDLEDCFFQIYKAELERFQRLNSEAQARQQSWRDRVRATAYVLFDFLAEDERVTNLTAIEVRGAGERVQLLFASEVTVLVDLIDEGRLEPGAPSTLTRTTAESIGGGIFNQIYVAALGGDRAPSSSVIPELMYAVVLPYLGQEAAEEELSIRSPPV